MNPWVLRNGLGTNVYDHFTLKNKFRLVNGEVGTFPNAWAFGISAIGSTNLEPMVFEKFNFSGITYFFRCSAAPKTNMVIFWKI